MIVYIVDGEHPFDPFYPQSVHATLEGATAKAVELTEMFLKAYWAIKNANHPLLVHLKPTAENWDDLVDRYGDDDDFVQEHDWGRWWVNINEMELVA
ncbi:hypothetical protein [Sphingomonas jaspsi]|uniref:hypothetical protein n=1 Tax=Sphingomonas jaspsi TaxID=392409 RepID=UPI0004B9D1FE|nr:hypothetical protein [Sphingomonas jaspsi]